MPTIAETLEHGLRLHEAGRLAEAAALYRQVLQRAPRHAEALHLLGMVAHQQGRSDEAVRLIRKAVERDGRDARFHNNLGIAYRALGRLEEAAASLRRALALQPRDPAAAVNLGNVLQQQGDTAAAAELFRHALALQPDQPEALYNLGNALAALGEPERASQCYRRLIQLHPEHADAHFNLAWARLRLGDFATGWREYEWRWRLKEFRSPRRDFTAPQWHGAALAGATILLHAEQGFGDTLQFVRYAPLVAARGGRVVLEVQPELLRLLAGLPGIAQVLARGSPLPDCAWQAPLMSLPLAFATTLDTIPCRIPYLAADPAAAAAWRARLGAAAHRRVGLVWAGSSNPRNALAPALLAPLAAIPGLSFFSLQKGPAAAAAAEAALPLTDLAPALEDFADTAAAVAALDLVITVDTAVAHLAGALGKPVWILLAEPAEWRWLLGRSDSPWYPSARLFRQPAPGAWDAVVAALGAALRSFAAEG